MIAVFLIIATVSLAIATETPDGQSASLFLRDHLPTDFLNPVGFSITAVAAVIAGLGVYRRDTLPWVTGASVLGTLSLVSLLHVLEPDNRPFEYVMSTYALTPHGYLVAPAVLCTSAAKLSLALFIHGIRRTKASFVTLLLLSVSAAGGILGAVYAMEPTLPPETMAGRLHLVGAMMMSLPFDFVAVVMTLVMGRDTFGRRLWLLVLIGSFGLLSGLAIIPSLPSGYAGLIQRVSVGSSLLWMGLAAFAVEIGSTESEDTTREKVSAS